MVRKQKKVDWRHQNRAAGGLTPPAATPPLVRIRTGDSFHVFTVQCIFLKVRLVYSFSSNF